jgi:hypothetical protein
MIMSNGNPLPLLPRHLGDVFLAEQKMRNFVSALLGEGVLRIYSRTRHTCDTRLHQESKQRRTCAWSR